MNIGLYMLVRVTIFFYSLLHLKLALTSCLSKLVVVFFKKFVHFKYNIIFEKTFHLYRWNERRIPNNH